jgi:putative glycolipid-binding protein
MNDSRSSLLTEPVASGRYALFFNGQECGGERWEIARTPDGFTITGEQELEPPHPLPNRQQYRAMLTPEWRPAGLDIIWRVGDRELVAMHRAGDGVWRVRIDYGGQVREQQGDYPDSCEVEFTTHLFNAVILARRDFQVGGEHEFPVLRIGPPYMAVSPDRMLYRCVERRRFDGPLGSVEAKRYVVTIPERGDQDGYTFWADEDGIVLESYEGVEPDSTWMRLVALERER